MKKLRTVLVIPILLISCWLIYLFADETAVQDPGNSRKGANSAKGSLGIFDKLGIVNASVNQFTGDLNASVPIISLPGRNGLDLNISLNYSSDVSHIMNNENYVQQAGWVGGGLEFELGDDYCKPARHDGCKGR